MKIARVFPSKTAATPNDELAFVNCDYPELLGVECDEVHISVAFTWDKQRAEILADAWRNIAPVKIGGPGWSNEHSGEFVPGRYMKLGYVITSRGCPNRCWFCSVWKREPGLTELPIREGNIVQDDNLLACSDRHIINVFRMLGQQRRAAHLMGLEAALLKPWHVDFLVCINPAAMWFAYDTPDDLEPLVCAGRLLAEAGFSRNKLYCYVLVGHPKDTFADAEQRLRRAWAEGFIPFAMLWRDEKGERDPEWRKFARPWSRPAAIKSMCAEKEETCQTAHNTPMQLPASDTEPEAPSA